MYQHHVPPDIMNREGHKMAFVVFLPQMQNLNFIMRKHQTKKKNWEKFFEIADEYWSKVLRSWKTKEGWGTITDWSTLRGCTSERNMESWIGARNRNWFFSIGLELWIKWLNLCLTKIPLSTGLSFSRKYHI